MGTWVILQYSNDSGKAIASRDWSNSREGTLGGGPRVGKRVKFRVCWSVYRRQMEGSIVSVFFSLLVSSLLF